MESHPAELIVKTVVALEGSPAQRTYLRALTTMLSPATPSTQSTTPYSTQGWELVKEVVSTLLPNPASSAPTSSSTQGSEKSLSYVQRAIEELAETLQSKNQDYRIDSEFSNFEYAAEVAGVVTTFDVILTQIGIKLGRIRGLDKDPNNESLEDSVKDLAGYAVILYAYLKSKSEDEVWVPGPNSEEEF